MRTTPFSIAPEHDDSMDTPLTRRRVIAAGGAGAALSLAGCNSFGSQDTQGSDGDASAARVTVFADLDQAALEEYQAELRDQMESGDISQQEAQQKAQQKQVELMTESVESFEERASENDDLSVEDRVTESGVLLAEGSAEAVVGTLDYEEVHGLLAASEFEQYRQGGGQAGGGQADGDDQAGGEESSGDGGTETAGESA